MEKGDLSRLILSIIICQMAGVIGSIFTASSVASWYPTLVKPPFTPPGFYIGLIWIVLFGLMGISLFLIWRDSSGGLATRKAFYFFTAQLIDNVLWSAAFFGMRSPISGLVVVALLWILILITIIRFLPLNRNAALLLVPYIIWVSFAAYLNYSIWRMNS
jgi:benzodiazapine receptor